MTCWFLTTITEMYEMFEEHREEINMAVQNNNTAQLKEICHDIVKDLKGPSFFLEAAINSVDYNEMLQELKEFIEAGDF